MANVFSTKFPPSVVEVENPVHTANSQLQTKGRKLEFYVGTVQTGSHGHLLCSSFFLFVNKAAAEVKIRKGCLSIPV